MSKVHHSFDYELFAKKHNIDQDILEQIIEDSFKEFPDDEMMAELHVIRALKSYRNNNKGKN